VYFFEGSLLFYNGTQDKKRHKILCLYMEDIAPTAMLLKETQDFVSLQGKYNVEAQYLAPPAMQILSCGGQIKYKKNHCSTNE